MPNEAPAPLKDLEDAELAYKRVESDANALAESELTPMNLDVVGACSIILGVAPRILAFRERMAALPEFDITHVDALVDRAKAAWYAVITNLPEPEPRDFDAVLSECAALRAKLLTWAVPLVFAGKFEQAAVDKIKEGAGNKDIPSDVVALVALYRAKWDEVRGICGVTEAELERAAILGPAVFATVSRRENKSLASQAQGSLRAKRCWTLADRAYDQCQRAIQFLQHDAGDAAVIAPSLRRNAGVSRGSSAPAQPQPASPSSGPAAPLGPPVGGGGAPFVG